MEKEGNLEMKELNDEELDNIAGGAKPKSGGNVHTEEECWNDVLAALRKIAGNGSVEIIDKASCQVKMSANNAGQLLRNAWGQYQLLYAKILTENSNYIIIDIDTTIAYYKIGRISRIMLGL